MKCKSCRRDLPTGSVYCNWCGAKQIKEKGGVTVRAPIKLKSGYAQRIMVGGKEIYIKAETEEEYYRKAREIKTGKRSPAELMTLQELIDGYIEVNKNILSPSTLRSYISYAKNRFQDYSREQIGGADWQRIINDEAAKVSPKTVKNAWGLITAALNWSGLKVPDINLPAVASTDQDFFDHQQILTFLQAEDGRREELAALLALHGLRASEIWHLEREDISDGVIHVRGATVRGPGSVWVDKKTNKNRTSTRDVPIIMPRVLQLLPDSGRVVTVPQQSVNRRIATVCKRCGLPVCSVHDLRRTFASLGAYLRWSEAAICALGGWAPGSQTVHKIYIKISSKEIAEAAKTMADYLADVADSQKFANTTSES